MQKKSEHLVVAEKYQAKQDGLRRKFLDKMKGLSNSRSAQKVALERSISVMQKEKMQVEAEQREIEALIEQNS